MLAGLIVAGCQTLLRAPGLEQLSSQRDQVRFADETSRRVDRYQIPAGDEPMALCVRIGLVAGALSWGIVNPEGQRIRGTEEAIQGEPYRATYCFEATTGTWRFEVELADATGQYEVIWRELGADPDVADYLLRFTEE